MMPSQWPVGVMPFCGSEPDNGELFQELLLTRNQNLAASLQPCVFQAQVQPMMMYDSSSWNITQTFRYQFTFSF
jgi:hypothetical protein